MKTRKLYLVALLLFIGLTGVSLTVSSQDTKPDRKSKKEARRARSERDFRSLDSLMSSGRYVLEANYLQNKYGTMVSVSSNLNFIRIDGPKGVLQTGSDFRQGYNGLGGVTAEGSVNNYKIERNLNSLSFSVTYQLMTNLGTFDINMHVGADNTASATITGTTSGRLTWRGTIVALNKSRSFKGQQTY